MATDIQTGDAPTVTDAEDGSDVTANLWTKKGRRLYLNGFGPSSANRYVDLDAGTVEGGCNSGLEVSVDEDADTLTVSGRGSTIIVDLGRGDGTDTDDPEAEDGPSADLTEREQIMAGELVADGGETATESDGDELSVGDVYVRRSYDGTVPARVEVVADDHYDYCVEIYDTHGTLKGTQNPAYPNSAGAAGVSVAKIERGIRDGHLELADADPGDLPPGTDERVAAFRNSDRAATVGDIVYDTNIFDRWQKHGHDRLYVRDPGEGHVDIGDDEPAFGEPLVHPEDPINHIGGIDPEIAPRETERGERVVYAHDGASSHWPILVLPRGEGGN